MLNKPQCRELCTSRLIGRPVATGDFATFRLLHADEAVMRTLSADGRVVPEAYTRNLIERFVAHWREHGDGVWLFRTVDDDRFVGYAGLLRRMLDGAPECELLYAVASAEWRHGYATEMARAVVSYVFDERREPSLVALVLTENIGSRRVIEKLGFVIEKTILHAGLPHLLTRLRVR